MFPIYPKSGTLCSALLTQGILLSQCLSPPGCIGTSEVCAGVGDNPVTEEHLIQGGVETLPVTSQDEIRTRARID